MNYDVLVRYEGNPILTAERLKDLPGGCNSVFNSSVIAFGNGFKAILRVEDRSGLQSLRVAESEDGIHFTVHPDRILLPETEEQKMYEEAIYDPRITQIGDRYYVCYAAESKYGCQVGLASTDDFKNFERHGCIAETENRNLVLFPEKIGGKYYRLDRPFQGQSGNIWMNESPDLIYWGRPRCIMESRRFHWDRGKIGAGAPPIRTKDGWLMVYHGTTPLCNGLIYRLGVALLDLERPWIVKHRAKAYILSPTEYYERVGDCPNVCFVNSAIPFFDRDEMWIYYGGADQCLCLAKCKISELITFCKTA
jgi:beta-1,4-mannooligosaccharide/beta-1,4-mannosyl-N-acetylglucosamine phosphorylase